MKTLLNIIKNAIPNKHVVRIHGEAKKIEKKKKKK